MPANARWRRSSKLSWWRSFTFIAFAAGGELRLAELRTRARSIGFTMLLQTVTVFAGVTVFVLATADAFPFLGGESPVLLFCVAALLGALVLLKHSHVLVHNHCGVRLIRHLAHGSHCEWVRQPSRCRLPISLLYPSTAYRPPCRCTISAACSSLCWSLLHVHSSPAGCWAERCPRPHVSHATKLARSLRLLRKTPESSAFPRSLRCCAIPRLHFPSLLPACPHKDPGLR